VNTGSKTPTQYRGPGASIEVVDVSKTFQRRGEKLRVLDRISLEAAAGEFVSIIGPSGCGKSTLFNILAGLESADGGQVKVNDAVATGASEHFAYKPQKDLLFPWRRVLDNATLGLEVQGIKKKEARQLVEPLIEKFGLTGFEHCYPYELSGGMRQRVALLRTVVQGRQIVLLDEPFGALDYLTRTELQLWLSSMWEQFRWTVVLVTHDVPEALLLSDRVYVLGNRPANVSCVLDVDLTRPRGLECIGTPRFAELEEVLLTNLRNPDKTRGSASIRSSQSSIEGGIDG
jgi:ABC-type nitrate/sulfonate/bicarbonate transport system ATPase subunit